MKNIPIADRRTYLKCLTDQVERLVRRMRLKVLFFNREQDEDGDTDFNSYGFKSTATPPSADCLTAFENDLYELIRGIQFTRHLNNFQQQLSSDVREVRNSNSILVLADKTTNMYLVSKDEYGKLLRDNITKNYKACSNNTKHSIDQHRPGGQYYCYQAGYC